MNIFSGKEVAPALTSLEAELVANVLDFTGKAVNRLSGMEGRKTAQLAIANTPNRPTTAEVIDTLVGMPNFATSIPAKPVATGNAAPELDIAGIREQVALLAGGPRQVDTVPEDAELIQFPTQPSGEQDAQEAA